jgi:hypothetical protein
MVTIYVERQVANPQKEKPYTGGEGLSIFFCVLSMIFALHEIARQNSHLREGLASARLATDVIRGKPGMDPNRQGVRIALDGQLKLQRVEFAYPSRSGH